MSRFPNKIVVGGSDRESSESEDEYMSGQEMVNLKYAQQCMYNATMYNVMIQNMMPCVPMPYIPPFGYPVPYPHMINEFPVNHPMAAGTYYRKGGRQHRSRRDKTKSRTRLEGDDEKNRPHHKQHHVVSHHQYYDPSSESDSENEYIYTGEKGVQACRSVNRKISADKSDNTLRHFNPRSSNNGVEQQKLQNNLPNISTPLQTNTEKSVQKASTDIAADLPSNQVCHDSNNSQQLTSRTERSSMVEEIRVISGKEAVRQILPSNDPDKQNAMMAMIERQQEKQTADVNVAVDHGDSGTYERDLRMGFSLSNGKSTLKPVKSSALLSVARQVSDQPTETTVISKSDQQIELPPLTTAKTAGPINDELEAKAAANYLPLSGPTLNEDKTECEASSTKTMDHTEATVDLRVVLHHDMDRDLPPVQGAGDRGYHGPDTAHSNHPAWGYSFGEETRNLKSPQSLHSLRKMWAEWETKYRPPPVSIYTLRCW